MNQKKYTVQQLINDPSFVRWATGKSDGEEAEKWDRWVKHSKDNREIALRAQKKITDVRFPPLHLPDIKEEWSRVSDDIRKNERLSFIREDQPAHNKDGYLLGLLFKVAAVLLIGAFTGFAIYMYQEPKPGEDRILMHTVQTEYGEKNTINLSDNSKIILAAGSQLSYKSDWLEHPVIRVRLSGEAFFSISHGTARDHPKFVVETEDGSASVWGTRFTVDTYGTGTQVVLEEGEVRVKVANAGESEAAETTMEPGEKAAFSKSQSQIEVSEVNPSVYTSWTTNELYFDNTPFSLLVNRIERTYGLEVIVEDPEISAMKLSGSIDFRSLDGLIKAVSEVMEVKINKTEEAVIIYQN